MRYENFRLEKGMYQEKNISFTQVLEILDPSEFYVGTAMEGLDAFQRQLKRFDIKVRGIGSDSVEKFFAQSESAVLFPEYVARAVRMGLEDSDIIPTIAASSTKLTDIEQATDRQIKLHKRGRMLVASYDAVRRQKIDLFSVALRQIGAFIARSRLEDAVDVLINGDSNSEPAFVKTQSWPNFDYDAILRFWTELDPYEMNTMLVSNDSAPDLIQNLSDKLSVQDQMGVLTSFGTRIIRSGAVPEKTVIGFDKRFALESVQVGDIMVETEKLIDKQFERAAITVTSGFSKIYGDAVRVLNVSQPMVIG